MIKKEGTFGCVTIGKSVIIKEFKIKNDNTALTYMKELYIIKTFLWSEYIVSYVDHSIIDSTITLEKMDCDLYDFMIYNNNLTENMLVNIIYKISMGVHHLNYYNIVHGDIKPENILVSYDGGNKYTYKNITIKLCDFGLSHKINMDIIDTKQSIGYQSPEVLINFIDKSKMDVYSIALIIYNHVITYDLGHQSDCISDHIRRYCNLTRGGGVSFDDIQRYVHYEYSEYSDEYSEYSTECYDDSYNSCDENDENNENDEYLSESEKIFEFYSSEMSSEHYDQFQHNSEDIRINGGYSNCLTDDYFINDMLDFINGESCAEVELLDCGYSSEFSSMIQNMLMFIPDDRYNIMQVLTCIQNSISEKSIIEKSILGNLHEHLPKSKFIIYRPNININTRNKCILFFLNTVNRSFSDIYVKSMILINTVYLFDRYLNSSTNSNKYMMEISQTCLLISLELIVNLYTDELFNFDVKEWKDRITKSVNFKLYIHDDVVTHLNKYGLYTYIRNLCSMQYYSMNSKSIFNKNDISFSPKIKAILLEMSIE